MVINKLRHIIYVFSCFCLLTIISGCDNVSKEAVIAASKKGLEKHLVEPESVQYRNITIAKSLDGIKYYVDDDKVSEILITKAPKLSDYPGVSPAQFKLLAVQAENEFKKTIRNKVDELNAEIANGSYRNVTGVCLEFNTKNKNAASEEFEKALCLYTDGNDEVDCLNIKLAADKGSLFNIDLSAVCK